MSELDQMRKIVSKIERSPEEIAGVFANELTRVVNAQISAATDPNGNPWPPRKVDGGKALQNIKVSAVPVGHKAIIRLVYWEAMHNNGVARGNVRRQILPDKGVPPMYSKPLLEAAKRYFAETVRGQ